MKLRKIIVVFMMVMLILESGLVPAKAGNNIPIKVVSINNKTKCVKVKVKIINNTKKDISFGNDFL